MIDTDAEPGDYAPYFERAETWQRFQQIRAESYACRDIICTFPDGDNCDCMAQARKPRCYRDRKAHALKIATTNAIRAKLGWEPLA